MFSKTCEYAIKIMIYLASRRQEGILRCSLEEIATAVDSPRPFSAKILHQLAKAGLLDSQRGRSGGFSLPGNKNISIADVVYATDGNSLMNACVLNFSHCNESHPCPLHFQMKEVRNQLARVLSTTTVEEAGSAVLENKTHFI